MSGAFEITPEFIYDASLQRAATAAGYTLLVYDYFLTLSDEIECIWYAPWTPVKFVYLANRYIVLLGQTVICIHATGIVAAVTGGCDGYAIFLTIYNMLALETVHVLVVLRARAIWEGDRRVLQSVVMAYIVALVSIVAAVAQKEHFDFSNFDPSVTTVCYRPVPDRAWLFYFANLVVDSIMFCMTMSGLWSYYRALNDSSAELIQVLVRGATAFYVVNVLYDVLGIVSWTKYQNSPAAFAFSAILMPLLAICGQRVVHDLRRTPPMSCSTRDLSQVINQQLGAFPSRYKVSVGGVSMILEGSSEGERERGSRVDEIGIAIEDSGELRPDDGAWFS